ncbi:hypothetical protein [Maridesulfovibrio bastinii]|uniref:hypothetical protein n=1 Tax=Maridesulfovibrio bastinii TaxID=47157 RepID=UPI0003FF1CB5|nr:hypothetical protein [Maridesulfovibrio bastinii]
MDIPRGIRNNNPGNIRHGINWEGLAELQPDKSFCSFKSPEYGIRAMAKILLTYQRKYGLNTVFGIINRWAPPVENDTGAYIEHVSSECGVAPHEEIAVADFLGELCTAIIRHENGQQPYEHTIIQKGIALALGLE